MFADLLPAFVSLAVLTYALCVGYRRVALTVHILDHPNHRSAHRQPTPTGGGAALIAVFALGLLLLWQLGMVQTSIPLAFAGPLFASVVGFVDDLRPLAVRVRVPLYLLAACWSLSFVGFPPLHLFGHLVDFGWIGFVFGIFALAWLQNLYNFMDGIDGLAISEVVFVCCATLVIGSYDSQWGIVSGLLASVCIGFAIINWPSAKLFMGDVGSSFLGLSLGILTLAQSSVGVWVWLILLAYFITDATLTIVIRLIRRERIQQSHQLHAYQHLTRRFGGRTVLFGVLSINLFWLLPVALMAHRWPDWGLALLILAAAPLLVGQLLCGAGQRSPMLRQVRV